ncbi:protein phosphatase CheZ [Luteimonas abyssi]|uniref:protein phosphatase CheZ n=1 Tax=Luteimonas abyssi TaxID=1247514 RepID=UPI000737AEA8|nr:protein phosphatase CheZ [Luteimonas abyssi]
MNAVTAATADRHQLALLLQDALDALERGDESAWRAHVDMLASARTRTLASGLGRLARELEQALVALPALPADEGLDDACARLDHVVEMTERATHHTLDLIDHSRALVTRLREGMLSGDAVADEQVAQVDTLRDHLRDMALAQSHQDLGGQIIRKVAGIVRRVHENLGALDLPAPEPDSSDRGHGPAVKGLDAGVADQNDADDLLARLGL